MTTEVWDYRDHVARLAQYLCRDPDDGEDVAHSALLKASERIEGFRGESTVETWLHAITLNECRMLRRKRRPASLNQVGEPVDIDEANDPEFVAEEAELRLEVLRAIAELSERQRCALLLREGQELSMEELADRLELTVPAVKSLLYRARQSLRKAML
ncbi:MAG: sigma-70 family RNA polymerase sigma factor [Acidimicrobiia bacterium]|nr:sigma-70 family RNA polymerase sigma factor [Acidimicrobiia bacterium]